MAIKQAGNIIFAILFSVLAGFAARTLQPSHDDCLVSALDAILAGGELTLADDCVLILDYERVITGEVTIQGGMLHGGGLQRVLHIAENATLTLRAVEVRVGVAELEPRDGGGIYNEGTLNLIDSHMAGNRANRGAAIFNAGTVSILRSQIDHNNARVAGGAIYNTGHLHIRDSIIAGNMATLNGNGIVNDGGTVDARHNYWGYPSGPRDGQVVGVDEADYTPWLTSLPDWARRAADDNTCSEEALDAVLAGGELTLPERCLIYVSHTKIITGRVVIRGEQFSGISAVGQHRVLQVAEGASLRLEHITITGGFVEGLGNSGAGILNMGRLTLIASHVSGNRSELASGTGIFNMGHLRLENSTINRNFSDGGIGAGLFTFGQATIIDSQISHNTIYSRHERRETPEFAAGIYNGSEGVLVIRNSRISDNSSPNAGGIFNFGLMTIEDSEISHNTTRTTIGCTGDGAGIFNAGQATLRRTLISDNRAGKWAGGIDNQGVMLIEDSTIVRNSACVGGGGIFNAFERADLTISNSIIADNSSEERPDRNNGLYNLITLDNDAGTVDAQHNYWGSGDGPGGDGPGSGDGISGVLHSAYTPWLSQPPDWAQQ